MSLITASLDDLTLEPVLPNIVDMEEKISNYSNHQDTCTNAARTCDPMVPIKSRSIWYLL